MSELIESAQVLVNRIYENMTNVEACEAIAEEVVEASIAFVKNGDKIILLNGVLTDYQVERIKEDVINQININKLESEIFLQNLSQFGPNKPDANVISTEAKGKDTIINQDFEDAVNDMVASREATAKKNLVIGDTFDIAGITWKILDIDERGYVCLADNKLDEVKKFDDDCNNWQSSDLRYYLNKTIYEAIAGVIGEDNIVEFERDLSSLDGQTEYGTCLDKVSLISIDEYRKYRKLIPNTDNYWWWTLTPDSTACNDDSRLVRAVMSSGGINFDNCINYRGVRPFCILKPNIFVRRY